MSKKCSAWRIRPDQTFFDVHPLNDEVIACCLRNATSIHVPLERVSHATSLN